MNMIQNTNTLHPFYSFYTLTIRRDFCSKIIQISMKIPKLDRQCEMIKIIQDHKLK